MYLEWSLGEAQVLMDLTLQHRQQPLKQLCNHQLHAVPACNRHEPVRRTHVGSLRRSSLGSLSGMKRFRSAKTSPTRVGSRNLHGAQAGCSQAAALGWLLCKHRSWCAVHAASRMIETVGLT